MDEAPRQRVKDLFGWCDQGSLSEKKAHRPGERKEWAVGKIEEHHVRE